MKNNKNRTHQNKPRSFHCKSPWVLSFGILAMGLLGVPLTISDVSEKSDSYMVKLPCIQLNFSKRYLDCKVF